METFLSAKNYDPAKITRYCIDLATLFHKFYNACRCDIEDKNLQLEIAERIINMYGDFIPDGDVGEGDCDHEALSNDEIQEVFDNDEK